MKILLRALALIGAVPAFAGAAPSSSTISKSEVRSAPPRRTNARLRDVIWPMFEHEDRRSERPPRRALSNIWMPTRVRATSVPNLCRFDSVWVEFAPTVRQNLGADTPVRAVGIRAHSRFRFLRPPGRVYNELRDYDALANEGPCARLSSRNRGFFQADNEEVATDGYRAFLQLQVAARGNGELQLECDLFPTDTMSCRELIASIDPEAIDLVRRCDSPITHQCYIVEAAERRIDVTVTGSVSPGPPPGQLVSARLTSLIVMMHELVD